MKHEFSKYVKANANVLSEYEPTLGDPTEDCKP